MKISMTEKRRLTVETILESDEPLTLTSRGKVIGAIFPDRAAAAAHRRDLARQKRAIKRKRPRAS